MYKAVNKSVNEDIIILDPKWINQIDDIRSLGKQNLLVCQECKEPMRVRAGEDRRWHFAHKHLNNCPYGKESPALLNARAVLYEWLVSKFGDKVVIEKKIADAKFPRSIDCWVDQDSGNIAYWIIDAGIKPEKREHLTECFKEMAVNVNWLFVSQMLREDKDNQDRINLSTTEREFMQKTKYDEIGHKGWGVAKSLHYLDADSRTITTFRGLYLAHEPQQYKGHKIQTEISNVLVASKSGEIVHPGECERLQQHKLATEQEALAIKVREEQRLQSPSQKGSLPWRQPGSGQIETHRDLEESPKTKTGLSFNEAIDYIRKTKGMAFAVAPKLWDTKTQIYVLAYFPAYDNEPEEYPEYLLHTLFGDTRMDSYDTGEFGEYGPDNIPHEARELSYIPTKADRRVFDLEVSYALAELKKGARQDENDSGKPALKCELCGVITSNYTINNGKTGMCWCKTCRDQGKWPL